MSAPAAGPGGRAAATWSTAPGNGRTSPRRGLRGWVPGVAVAMLVLGTSSPGAAAPGVAAPGAVAHAPADETRHPDRPLVIEVGRLEPRTVTDGSTITVSGTVTNTGGSALRDLEMRLQRGGLLDNRAELVTTDTDPDPATAVVADFEPVPGLLAPGGSLPFSYQVPAEQLRFGGPGVYPALVNVNATDEAGLRRRVGELATFLVHRPAVPRERTAVAWLWPVVADSSRRVGGGFADDGLARAISPDGRLDRVLAVLERLPRTASTTGGSSGGGGDAPAQPALPVTMAVDPALVEELAAMAAGPYAVAGVPGAGQGTEAAAAFLERLRALAAVHPVLALPYGDVDADALADSGLTDVITRSLPGTAAGTAEDPPGAPEPGVPPPPAGNAGAEETPAQDTPAQDTPAQDTPAQDTPAQDTPAQDTPAGESGGGGDGSAGDSNAGDGGTGEGSAGGGAGAITPADELGAPAGAGARILQGTLGVQPRTDLAWAASGSFRDDTVATLRAGGIDRLVVGPVGLSQGEAAVGLAAGVASAHTSVETDDGAVQVLVADTGLATLAATAEDRRGGPRIAEQRYLAELAVLGQQAPDGSTPTVLVAPRREVDPGPDGVGAMMADTAGLPWLQPVSLETLLGSPAVGSGRLTDPADAVLLAREGMARVAAAENLRDELAAAVVDDADLVLRAYDAALARATSVTRWDDPTAFAAAAGDLRTALSGLLERVGLVAPADGTYSLASSDAPLVLTVQNDLPFAVTVLLDLSTRGTRGIDISDIGAQVLVPGERTTLQVPTQVRQSGRFAVTARLTTPGGVPLGDAVRLQVQSTAYGSISLLITFGAAGLLGLLFLRRLVLLVLRRRRTAAQDGHPVGPVGPGGVAVPLPPTRSPV